MAGITAGLSQKFGVALHRTHPVWLTTIPWRQRRLCFASLAEACAVVSLGSNPSSDEPRPSIPIEVETARTLFPAQRIPRHEYGLELGAGDIIAVGAETPHKFRNSGSDRLDIICIHAPPRTITHCLES